MPVLISTVVIGQLWLKIYNPDYGILNRALAALGLWLACGRSLAKEAVYPVENARAWTVRGPVAWLKAVFRPARTASENQRLRTEAAALRAFALGFLAMGPPCCHRIRAAW